VELRARAEGLLFKAHNDLLAARATVATEEALDTVCFHAQQAVEKSLKAVLAVHDVEYPYTHDVQSLLALCTPLQPEVSEFEEAAADLTQYGVTARYDEQMYPDLKTAGEALQIAERVYQWACQLVQASPEA
jgi:HEPN domain-containing protein